MRPFRLLLLLAVAVAAAALAAPAGAQFVLGGVLVVGTTPTITDVSLGSAAGAGTASATIFVPAGFGLSLDRPVGVEIGKADVSLASAADPDGDGAQTDGSVVVEDPARAAIDPRVTACAPGAHLAVWRLEPLDLPVVVDRTTGSEAALGDFRMRICPDLRPGLTFRSLDLQLTRTVVTPSRPGLYVWRALMTPRTPSGAADSGGTYELRSIVPWPAVLTLHARRTGRGRALLYGRLLLAGRPRSGATIQMIRFTSSSGGDSFTFTVGESLSARTDRAGRFRRPVRVRRRTSFVAIWFAPPRQACSSPSPAPGGCVAETTSPALSGRAVVRPG